ncbi:hypothetical protein PHMEG_00034906, partial [Phytophthora megakarya]
MMDLVYLCVISRFAFCYTHKEISKHLIMELPTDALADIRMEANMLTSRATQDSNMHMSVMPVYPMADPVDIHPENESEELPSDSLSSDVAELSSTEELVTTRRPKRADKVLSISPSSFPI